jgi:hypothetical protein
LIKSAYPHKSSKFSQSSKFSGNLGFSGIFSSAVILTFSERSFQVSALFVSFLSETNIEQNQASSEIPIQEDSHQSKSVKQSLEKRVVIPLIILLVITLAVLVYFIHRSCKNHAKILADSSKLEEEEVNEETSPTDFEEKKSDSFSTSHDVFRFMQLEELPQSGKAIKDSSPQTLEVFEFNSSSLIEEATEEDNAIPSANKGTTGLSDQPVKSLSSKSNSHWKSVTWFSWSINFSV